MWGAGLPCKSALGGVPRRDNFPACRHVCFLRSCWRCSPGFRSVAARRGRCAAIYAIARCLRCRRWTLRRRPRVQRQERALARRSHHRAGQRRLPSPFPLSTRSAYGLTSNGRGGPRPPTGRQTGAASVSRGSPPRTTQPPLRDDSSPPAPERRGPFVQSSQST